MNAINGILHVALMYLLVSTMVGELSLGVERVIETFSGDGSFSSVGGTLDGLDSPGWVFQGDGAIDVAGLRIENYPTPDAIWQVDRLQRVVDGFGSFAASIALDDLVLVEVDGIAESFSHVGWCFTWDLSAAPRPSECANLVSREMDVGGGWELNFGDDIIVVPTLDSSVRFTVDYDADRHELTLMFSGIDEGDIAPITIGPVGLPGIVNESEHRQTLIFEARGNGGISAILTEYRIQGEPNLPGDFSGNEALDPVDIDILSHSVRSLGNDVDFDLTDDSLVDEADRIAWVHDLAQTYFGDANLDGEFASSDLINVFTAGEYEDGTEGNSGWATGDWNGDTEFTSSDLVLAFRDGGYEQGARGAASVPEPGAAMFLLVGGVLIGLQRCRLQTPFGQ